MKLKRVTTIVPSVAGRDGFQQLRPAVMDHLIDLSDLLVGSILAKILHLILFSSLCVSFLSNSFLVLCPRWRQPDPAARAQGIHATLPEIKETPSLQF